MLKCSSDRCVCAPHNLSAGTRTSPRLSDSVRKSAMCCSSAATTTCAVSMIVPGLRPDLAPEHGVADGGVDQHQLKDEQAFAPEHEGETGMRRRRLLDCDRERNHVGPERDRQR